MLFDYTVPTINLRIGQIKMKRGFYMSEHEHNHDCGCGHDHDHEEATVTLTLDDGTVLECVVLTIFPAGDFEYIALLPLTEDGDDEDEGEVFLYRYQELEDGEIELLNIEDDEEYELVSDAFDELLDEAEYDEYVDEDEID